MDNTDTTLFEYDTDKPSAMFEKFWIKLDNISKLKLIYHFLILI